MDRLWPGRRRTDRNGWMELRGEGKRDTRDKHAKLSGVKPTDEPRRLDNGRASRVVLRVLAL